MTRLAAPSSLEVEVEVADPRWLSLDPALEALVTRAATAALAEQSGEISILLTDDAALKALNHRFRGQDKATNVLSFPAAATARPHLGDLALGLEVCQAEAQASGKAFSDHLSHLIVHGALHLIGHDHQDEAEAEVMEGLERVILARLGLSDPYA